MKVFKMIPDGPKTGNPPHEVQAMLKLKKTNTP